MDIEEAIAHARQVAEDCSCGVECAYQHDRLADWLEELLMLRSERDRLITERDEAANCIYGVKQALENGDRVAAMEEIITFEYKIGV